MTTRFLQSSFGALLREPHLMPGWFPVISKKIGKKMNSSESLLALQVLSRV